MKKFLALIMELVILAFQIIALLALLAMSLQIQSVREDISMILEELRKTSKEIQKVISEKTKEVSSNVNKNIDKLEVSRAHNKVGGATHAPGAETGPTTAQASAKATSQPAAPKTPDKPSVELAGFAGFGAQEYYSLATPEPAQAAPKPGNVHMMDQPPEMKGAKPEAPAQKK